MVDEKIKQKEEELINLVSNFCDDKLNDEYKQLSIKLIQKLGRKREVPFKRGKLENWAGGVIYALAQINFLFDKSFEPHISTDDICDYFKTKKSTTSNKARDIRKMLNLDYYNNEFSTQHMLNSQPRLYRDIKTGLIMDEKSMDAYYGNPELKLLIDKLQSFNGDVPNEFIDEFTDVLMNSKLLTLQINEIPILECDGKLYFAFFTSFKELKKVFPHATTPLVVPFYEYCKHLSTYPETHNIEDVVINPDSQQFEISSEKMKYLYSIFR